MWAAFSALPLTGLISVLNPMLIKVMRPAARIGKSSNDLWRLENHRNGGTIAMFHIRYISGIDDTDRCLQTQGFHIWFHQRFLHQWRQQDRSNQKKGMQPRCLGAGLSGVAASGSIDRCRPQGKIRRLTTVGEATNIYIYILYIYIIIYIYRIGWFQLCNPKPHCRNVGKFGVYIILLCVLHITIEL